MKKHKNLTKMTHENHHKIQSKITQKINEIMVKKFMKLLTSYFN